MKISPIASNNYPSKQNFKAEVRILPSAAHDNQPNEDRYLMNAEAKRLQLELQRRFPSSNDNIQILIEPNGYRLNSRLSKSYINSMKVYMGYKDPEIARQNILRRSINPPHADYVALTQDTISKVQRRDPEIMKKIQKKVDTSQDYFTTDDIRQKATWVGNDLINDVIAIVNNALDYGVTEYVEPTPNVYTSEGNKTDYWI